MLSRTSILLACLLGVCSASADASPNNRPMLNQARTAATFSIEGVVNLDDEFHSRLGANGRTCQSCHLPQPGWSIRPIGVPMGDLAERRATRVDGSRRRQVTSAGDAHRRAHEHLS